MRLLLKIIFSIIIFIIFAIVSTYAFVNLVYLPQKVKTEGQDYLAKISKRQVKAKYIQYIPFRGVRLIGITFLTKEKKTVFSIDRLDFGFRLWPLIIRKELEFRIDLYPTEIKKPYVFNGAYRLEKKELNLDCKIKNTLFAQEQFMNGNMNATFVQNERPHIELNIFSRDLNVQGNFYIQDKDFNIEELSVNILGSSVVFIGDVQNLSDPSLNIYGEVDLDLRDLRNINPEYIQELAKLNIDGYCRGRLYLSSKVNNPEIGLKLNASEVFIEKTKITDFSFTSKMQDKKFSITKLYGRLYAGEINLQSDSQLDSPGLDTTLNLNLFNLDLNEIAKDISGKDIPVHGRLFSLARLSGSPRNPKDVQGSCWISVAGSNILQLPLLTGVVDIMRLPQLRKFEFKEASGNFAIGQQAIRTEDFKIVSDSMVIYYKGYLDFAGNISFDVQPSFSEEFSHVPPNISNILGMFLDTTGNFLGEIKLKGTIKEPRYTFKPISKDKIFPGGLEKGLKELFKLKKEE